MRGTNRILLLVGCVLLPSCEDRPEPPAADVVDATAEDVDARVVSDIAVSVLADPDDPPRAPPLAIRGIAVELHEKSAASFKPARQPPRRIQCTNQPVRNPHFGAFHEPS